MPQEDYIYPGGEQDQDETRIQQMINDAMRAQGVSNLSTAPSERAQGIVNTFEAQMNQMTARLAEIVNWQATNDPSRNPELGNTLLAEADDLRRNLRLTGEAILKTEKSLSPTVRRDLFEDYRDSQGNVVGRVNRATGTLHRETASPDQVEITNRTRQQQEATAGENALTRAHQAGLQQAESADKAAERTSKERLADDARAFDAKQLAWAQQLAYIKRETEEKNMTLQEANSMRQFIAAERKDETDRLGLVIQSINQQDRSAIDTAWAKSVGISYDTWKELSTHVREANKRDFEESVTAYAGEEKQRAGDMKIAMDLAKSKVDAYEAAAKGMTRGTNEWWAAFEKGLEFVAAGRPLPKDLFVGLAAPSRPTVDPDMMRREFANIMGTTFENPLPARTKFSEYQRAQQGPPTQPNYATPPTPTLTPSELFDIAGIGFDPGRAQTPTQAVSEAGGEPLTEDFLLDDEGNVTGEPRQVEQTDSELLQLPGDVWEPTTMLDEQMNPDREDEDLAGEGFRRIASMPGAEEDYYMPDPENDMILELAPEILSPVLGHAFDEGGPEYIGRIGATISSVALGNSPEDAILENWGDTGREWIDYEDSSFFEEEPWGEESSFTFDVEDYYQEPVYADSSGWEDYEYGV